MRSIKLLLQYKRSILILAVFGFISSFFLLLAPYLSSLYIDKSFLEKDLAVFLKLSVVGVAVFLFSTLAKFSKDILRKRIAVKVKLNLARKLLKKIYSLDIAFSQSNSVGENIYRASNIEPLADFITEQVPNVLVILENYS